MALHIDAHVHLYPCYDLSRLHLNALQPLALLLTERSTEHFFVRLAEDRDSDWTLRDPSCLLHRKHPSLYLFAGSQIISREGLELHALICTKRFSERLPIDDLLPQIREAGGIPTLPFSPGKWLGARGRKVLQLINSSSPGQVLFSDSRLRPLLWHSSHLALARQRGFTVLEGSDPLPYRGEERSIASIGVKLDLDLSGDSPSARLKSAIAQCQLAPFGVRPLLCGSWLRALLRL